MKMVKKTIFFIAVISFICFALICIFGFFSGHAPYEGIWVCDEPYIRLNADTGQFFLESDGQINEYHIGYGDELFFTVGIKENGHVHYLFKGSIVQYGEKVHIKSDERGFDCWLYREDDKQNEKSG